MDPNMGGFAGFLEDRGLAELDILDDGDERFANRMKLQKYALLAKRLGMPFPHTACPCGPYSNNLAADYEALARNWPYGE